MPITRSVRQTMTLTAMLVALSSCAVLETQTRDSSARGERQTSEIVQASTTATAPNAASSVQVSAGTNSAEQQALLDAINRDGQASNFGGFRGQVPAPAVIDGEDIVELNYEQADLRLVLEELADALDITIIIDPSIDTKISIRTSENRPLRTDDIWPLIRLLTRDAGIVLEQVGNVYNAIKLQSSLTADIVTPATLGDGSAAKVMQVTPLTYVSSEAVIQALEPLLAPNGEISQLSNSNLLVITGSEYQLQRINQLLLLLDSDPFRNQGIHLYQLSNAIAAEVADELTEILQLIEGPSPAYQVRGIERINAILVTAPAARGFDEISRWIQILDAASQEQVEQLFMYRVKSLVATELAATLSEVFEEDDEPVFAAASNPERQQPLFGESNSNADNRLTTEDRGNDSVFTTGSNNSQQAANNNATSADISVKIVADEATNSLLIRSTFRDYLQLLTTINQLDVVPLQVMVNAIIAQITLTDDNRFGVDWSRVAANNDFDPISSGTSTNFVPNLGGLLFTKGFLDGSARIDATLEAIAVNNDVRLLARPSLTVSNNQEGEIKIGAEVPVEAGESIGTGGISTTNIQYRDTGIELYITPQINTDGIINLEIRQVLSSVDSSATGVNNNPVFNNQEISTTVVVRDGESIVLGGLIQTDNEMLSTGVPVLKRVPLLGRFFSYQQEKLERRELFIVLRPEIIDLNAESGPQYADILDRFELASDLFEEAGL